MQPSGTVLTAVQSARKVRELLEAAEANGQPVSIAIKSTDAKVKSIELFVRYVTRTEAVCITNTVRGSSPAIVSLGELSEQDAVQPTIIIGDALPN